MLILVIGFLAAVLLSMCGMVDKHTYKYVHTEMDNLRVVLYDGNGEVSANQTVSHAHLRVQ